MPKGSSMSGKVSVAISNMTVEELITQKEIEHQEGLAAIGVKTSAGGIDDQIPEWIFEKNLSSAERTAWNAGDGSYIARETEKAVLVENRTDFGTVSMWVPKSVLGKKDPQSAVKQEVRGTINRRYGDYLKQLASSHGVKVGNLSSWDKIKAKLQKNGITAKTRDEFAKTKIKDLSDMDSLIRRIQSGFW